MFDDDNHDQPEDRSKEFDRHFKRLERDGARMKRIFDMIEEAIKVQDFDSELRAILGRNNITMVNNEPS